MHGIIDTRAYDDGQQARLDGGRRGDDAGVLSDVQEQDKAQAATRRQMAMTQLQASLQAGSSVLNQSLLDFLG